ncbi:MAG TPA: PmoA family protein [Arenibacter sp.]|nr:PmoA family protein [Arenibacter sp.]
MREKKRHFPLAVIGLLILTCLYGCKQEKNKSAMQADTNKGTEKRIQLVRDDAQNKVSVMIEGKLFTAYLYPDNIKKPILYPLITPQGSNILRKYPMEPSVGERVDHPHQVGVWFNYGDVNGLDFWNNSDSIKLEIRERSGTIVHKDILNMNEGDEQASLEVAMDWIAPDGEVLLNENTIFIFQGRDDEYSVDRITKLTATNKKIIFKDNKEGMLGIRVARELEHPSDKPDIFTDANGIPTAVPVLNNEGVNGNYINSEGIQGNDVWGKRSDWVNLTSSIGEEKISLVILDHSGNAGYPTYWHARGYGLFAANPLGQEVFSDGKESLNLSLEPGEDITFKHRIIVASKDMGKSQLDSRFAQFSKE